MWVSTLNKNRKVVFILLLSVVVFVVLALAQDLLTARLNNSAFYFSEAFMFSSFWWIFAPLLFAQYLVLKKQYPVRAGSWLLLVIVPPVIHLFAFPFLVWMLSKLFYYHTYRFQQTFNYTLSEYAYLLILFYALPVAAYPFFIKKERLKEPVAELKQEEADSFIHSILVSEGNKKLAIDVAAIQYFSANPPYINVHYQDKRYLYAGALKTISRELDPEKFVRIHRSTIVNIQMVASYTTRLNGDYDLLLNNNIQLRVSRNYAADFKNAFSKTHRFTAK
jgi:hypothetical protein